VITGAGSKLTATSGLQAGSGGNNSTFAISAGGAVENSGDGVVGGYGTGNSATITNGSWTSHGSFQVGYAGNNNQLDVNSGGVVAADVNAYVGQYGSSNTLTLSGGGQMTASSFYSGWNSACEQQQRDRHGPGSKITTVLYFLPGYSGDNNTLTNYGRRRRRKFR
jgi:hypothetical protein